MSNEIAQINGSNSAMIALGRRIVQALVPTENAIDVAIADGANLLSVVVSGRIASGLSADTGHESIHTIIRGLNLLADARTEFLSGHSQLTAVRDAHHMTASELGCSATKRMIGARHGQVAA